jgi:hypothetical protein
MKQTLFRSLNGANGQTPPPAEIDLVCMSEISPRPISWLWPGRLARRKLTLISGDPDLGKSQIGLDAIARLTTEQAWPDEASERAPLGGCIILSAEDAGADLGRVHTVKSDGDLWPQDARGGATLLRRRRAEATCREGHSENGNLPTLNTGFTHAAASRKKKG